MLYGESLDPYSGVPLTLRISFKLGGRSEISKRLLKLRKVNTKFEI